MHRAVGEAAFLQQRSATEIELGGGGERDTRFTLPAGPAFAAWDRVSSSRGPGNEASRRSRRADPKTGP